MHPLSVEIVKQYTDLASGGSSFLEEVQTYDGEAEQSKRAFDLCVNGQAAMWLDRVSSYSLLGYTPLSQTQISMVTLPFGDDPASYLSADRFVMSKGTLHPEESWRWLRFLTYQVLRNPRVRLPARQSVAQDIRYWERWEDRERDTINYALKHAHASSEWISDNYYKAAIDAVLNGQSVEEALSEAQVQVMHMASVRESAPPLPPLSMVETGSVVEPGGIQITFAAMDLYTARYRQLADEFNAIQSDVYVEIEPITHRNTADCFTSLKYEDKTQINLEPLIQSDQTFSFDNVPSALWDPFQDQGRIYGLPVQADHIQVIVYNRDIFDAAGIPYPQPEWSLEEFITKASALTQGSGEEKRYGYMALEGHQTDILPFLAMQGAALWDGQGQPRFNAPEVIAAVQSYRDLALLMNVMPIFPSDLLETAPSNQRLREQWVATGRVAMWEDTLSFNEDVIHPNTNWGIAPWPTGHNGGVARYLPVGLSVSKTTRYPEACWQWFNFVSSQTDIITNIPAQRSILTSPDYIAYIGEERARTYQTIIEYKPVPMVRSLDEEAELYWFLKALSVILEGTPVEQALTEAQQRANQLP
jgi:ABC-type glycerol-3-phosphate transport system substrate-binding protein